ncbi:MAG: transposase [Actinomycetota bacterium]|nr:transposase [Actinomycetota bacterium]
MDGFFEKFGAEERSRIEAVAMDKWDPSITSAREHLEDANDKIVFDRYHLMKYLTGAVDTVRRKENRALAAGGDKSLSGTKHLWVYSAENLPERHQDRFAILRGGDLKTARAWATKESLRHFWSYMRRGWGEKHWKRWYYWATHSRIQAIRVSARGYRNREHFKTAIWFHLGGLQLYPITP